MGAAVGCAEADRTVSRPGSRPSSAPARMAAAPARGIGTMPSSTAAASDTRPALLWRGIAASRRHDRDRVRRRSRDACSAELGFEPPRDFAALLGQGSIDTASISSTASVSSGTSSAEIAGCETDTATRAGRRLAEATRLLRRPPAPRRSAPECPCAGDSRARLRRISASACSSSSRAVGIGCAESASRKVVRAHLVAALLVELPAFAAGRGVVFVDADDLGEALEAGRRTAAATGAD